MVAATFGDALVPVLIIMQFSFPFMAMMSYQIIISDNLSTIVRAIGRSQIHISPSLIPGVFHLNVVNNCHAYRAVNLIP